MKQMSCIVKMSFKLWYTENNWKYNNIVQVKLLICKPLPMKYSSYTDTPSGIANLISNGWGILVVLLKSSI